MKLNDMNETILSQMDPQVAIALIEAQKTSEIWDAVGIIGIVFGMAAMFWIAGKYS